MFELHLPWLELAIVTPLIGAALVFRVRDPELAWRRAIVFTFTALCFTVGEWQDFNSLHTFEAHDHWDIVTPLVGPDAIVVDELSAPLIPLAALLFFLVTLTTMKTKNRRFPFAWNMISLSLLLALLSCRQPWGIIALLTAQAVPPWIELRSRGRSTRVFAFTCSCATGL